MEPLDENPEDISPEDLDKSLKEEKDIGRRLMKLRRKEGMTQKEFADRLGVTVTTISNWEKGRRNLNWINTTYEICQILNCDLADLANRKETPSYEELARLYREGKLREDDSG